MSRRCRLAKVGLGCEAVSSLLSEFLDGETEPGVAHAVALHLGGCAPCAQLAAELEMTVAALHRLPRGFLRTLAPRSAPN